MLVKFLNWFDDHSRPIEYHAKWTACECCNPLFWRAIVERIVISKWRQIFRHIAIYRLPFISNHSLYAEAFKVGPQRMGLGQFSVVRLKGERTKKRKGVIVIHGPFLRGIWTSPFLGLVCIPDWFFLWDKHPNSCIFNEKDEMFERSGSLLVGAHVMRRWAHCFKSGIWMGVPMGRAWIYNPNPFNNWTGLGLRDKSPKPRSAWIRNTYASIGLFILGLSVCIRVHRNWNNLYHKWLKINTKGDYRKMPIKWRWKMNT